MICYHVPPRTIILALNKEIEIVPLDDSDAILEVFIASSGTG